MPKRLMYVECKEFSLKTGVARVGWCDFAKSGKSLRYRGETFERLRPCGHKANYRSADTGMLFWISGPKKDGRDRLYATNVPAEIDEDARAEYWSSVRGMPENSAKATTR